MPSKNLTLTQTSSPHSLLQCRALCNAVSEGLFGLSVHVVDRPEPLCMYASLQIQEAGLRRSVQSLLQIHNQRQLRVPTQGRRDRLVALQ